MAVGPALKSSHHASTIFLLWCGEYLVPSCVADIRTVALPSYSSTVVIKGPTNREG